IIASYNGWPTSTHIPIGRAFSTWWPSWPGRRAVLSWRQASTVAASFCVAALEEALARLVRPEILNIDQGSQGGFKWSSQHLDEGGCDEHSKAAFGSIWAGAIVVTRSTAGGRTRRAATVLGSYRGRHGE